MGMVTARLGVCAVALACVAPWTTTHAGETRAQSQSLPAALAARAQSCDACHDGKTAATPVIAGQHAAYLYLQLRDYQSGNRTAPRMKGAVDGLGRDQLVALARHFAAREWAGGDDTPAAAEQRHRARSAISNGECTQCHLGGFRGDSRVPRLAGQHAAYLQATMHDFKHGRRHNSPAMADLLEGYDDTELDAMAAYLGGYEAAGAANDRPGGADNGD